MFERFGIGKPPVGRTHAIALQEPHFVNGHLLVPPFPDGIETAIFGMGCFWGAERLFWQQPGVYVTAVGYAGGETPNPTYDEVCTGATGHAETVLVAFDPRLCRYDDLLTLFWQAHDPTQGMRQGNDVGSQYRSVIYASSDDQLARALASRDAYGTALAGAGRGSVTTEIRAAPPFYYAEPYHQQYLAKHPDGYCGLRGTGVAFPQGCSN